MIYTHRVCIFQLEKGVKTMPMTPKQMVKFLKENGFRKVRHEGSHLTMRNEETEKQTVVPMHNKDLSRGTEQAILKQAGLK